MQVEDLNFPLRMQCYIYNFTHRLIAFFSYVTRKLSSLSCI